MNKKSENKNKNDWGAKTNIEKVLEILDEKKSEKQQKEIDGIINSIANEPDEES